MSGYPLARRVSRPVALAGIADEMVGFSVAGAKTGAVMGIGGAVVGGIVLDSARWAVVLGLAAGFVGYKLGAAKAAQDEAKEAEESAK